MVSYLTGLTGLTGFLEKYSNLEFLYMSENGGVPVNFGRNSSLHYKVYTARACAVYRWAV
jgi:hypothetical protein